MPVYTFTSEVTFTMEAGDEEDAIYEIEHALAEVAFDWTALELESVQEDDEDA